MRDYKIQCANCGYEIEVEKTFLKQTEGTIRQEIEKKYEKEIDALNAQKEKLQKEISNYENLKKSEEAAYKKQLEGVLAQEKVKLKKEISAEFESRIKKLEKDNEELQEKQEYAGIEMQKKLLNERENIENEIRKKEHERHELVLKEYDRKLADQKKLIEELRKKPEQNLSKKKMTGAELAGVIKGLISPDDLSDAGKSSKGQDHIITVKDNDTEMQAKIVCSIRSGEKYLNEWLDTVKEKQKNSKAEEAILFTDVLPDGQEGLGRIDGVWISTYEDAGGVLEIVKEKIVIGQTVRISETAQRMESYLTGDGFIKGIDSMVAELIAMQEQLDKEKRAMHSVWEQRKKQCEEVMNNAAEIYGAVKGIGGKKIKRIDTLELE